MLESAFRLMFFSPNTIGSSMPEAKMILLEAVNVRVEAVIELKIIWGILIGSYSPSVKLAAELVPVPKIRGVKVTSYCQWASLTKPGIVAVVRRSWKYQSPLIV